MAVEDNVVRISRIVRTAHDVECSLHLKVRPDGQLAQLGPREFGEHIVLGELVCNDVALVSCPKLDSHVQHAATELAMHGLVTVATMVAVVVVAVVAVVAVVVVVVVVMR